MKKTRPDLVGRQFGRLTVQSPAPSRDGKGAYWQCLCECGRITSVRHSNLISGNTRSCGCQAKRRRGLAPAM